MPERLVTMRGRVVRPIAGLVVVALVVIGDVFVDFAVRAAGEPSISIAGDLLRLAPSTNAGMAFGLLSGVDPMAVTLLAGLVLTIAVVSARRVRGHLLQAAIWLLLGGGVANLVERAAHGGVLDYVASGLGAPDGRRSTLPMSRSASRSWR